MYSPFHGTPLAQIAKSSLYDLPSPVCLTRNWNFGSSLGMCLVAQISTGVVLAMHYSCDVCMAFDSVSHIMRDVSGGWSLRSLHANGASMFFILIYLHIFRGLYYGSYGHTRVWLVGSLIMFLLMAAAFLGYVLPWGQMSFWGATVITNLVSAVPRVGPFIVEWIWGGFAIGNSTLTRFFTFHFVAPFLLAGMVGLHLVHLHDTGSSNPLGINSNMDKVSFHPYFSLMDLSGFIFFGGFLLGLCLFLPWDLGDPENFNTANPLVTPLHIQPEWYFLFAYAILRSIPNKLGGVVALVSSVAILFTLPFLLKPNSRSAKFSPRKKFIFWTLVIVVILLTWIGARPVEEPYILTGQVLTFCYFSCFLLYS